MSRKKRVKETHTCFNCGEKKHTFWYFHSICSRCYCLNQYWLDPQKAREKQKKFRKIYMKDPKKRKKKNESDKKFTRTIRGKFGYGKQKALLREIEFDLDFIMYEKYLKKGCHYCGKDLATEVGVGLDRIDNSKGYIKGNVLPCCGIHNKLRGNYLTVKEAEIAIAAVESYRTRGKSRLNNWYITVRKI